MNEALSRNVQTFIALATALIHDDTESAMAILAEANTNDLAYLGALMYAKGLQAQAETLHATPEELIASIGIFAAGMLE